jgi:hypothetical protein
VFKVASASVVVVRVRTGIWLPEIVRVSAALAVCGVGEESDTTKVSGYDPATAGVPEIVPPAARFNPAGSVPELRDHV